MRHPPGRTCCTCCLGWLAPSGYEDVVCGDAAKLPWAEDEFDLGRLHVRARHARPPTVISEIARVLERNALLCIALIHPLNRSIEHLEDYFA